ncbi:MAG: B12-binding domain-containing radical SAM protein [Planctomycetota bacterium]|jgi:radical SAM superfamily enzyme YgiQ (UPF0313 family)
MKKALLIDLYWVRDYDLSLALGYLKAYADADERVRQAWEIELAHLPVDTPASEVVRTIVESGADLVGFSCYMWNMQAVGRVIAGLPGEKRPVVALGGVEVTPHPAQALGKNPGADLVVVGEGEETFRSLLLRLHETEGLDREIRFGGLEGIVWRDGKSIHTNPNRAPIADLSSLPSPYLSGAFGDRLDGRPFAAVETTRGCPFQCSFCYESRGFKKVRSFPLERVKKEVERLVRSGVREIAFLDTNFNLYGKRAVEILQTLKALGGKVRYVFELWGERLDAEQIEAITGVEFVAELGLQTTNPKALKAMKRTLNRERFETKVKGLLDASIYRPCSFSKEAGVMIDIIAGLPHDRVSDVMATFDYVFGLAPSKVGLSVMKVLPGTPVHDDRKKYGYRFDPARQYIMLSSNLVSKKETDSLIYFDYAVEFAYNKMHAVRTIGWLAERLRVKPSSLFMEIGFRIAGWEKAWEQATPNDLSEILADICREHGKPRLARKASSKLTAEMILNVLQHFREQKRSRKANALFHLGFRFLSLFAGLPSLPESRPSIGAAARKPAGIRRLPALLAPLRRALARTIERALSPTPSVAS